MRGYPGGPLQGSTSGPPELPPEEALPGQKCLCPLGAGPGCSWRCSYMGREEKEKEELNETMGGKNNGKVSLATEVLFIISRI